MLKGKIVVAQGGGPTAVINESIVGVVIEARKISSVERVYGAQHGIQGIIEEEFLDLTQETSHNLNLVGSTPSAALGSTRDYPDYEYCERIVSVFKAHGISTFFYIGGNDSSSTLQTVSEVARKENYDLCCIHIPKTIDNDLVHNDHTPGFPSAARYVANVFMGINQDNIALPTIYLSVVMGRNSGFLTASSALARKYPDDGPHLIYVPEKPFCKKRFVEEVTEVYNRLGRCVIAVSEGVRDKEGVLLAERVAREVDRDPHGNIVISNATSLLSYNLGRFIKEHLSGIGIRADTIGHPQRTYPEAISDIDRREAREVGEKAVQFAHWQNRNGSICIERTGFYSVDYSLRPLLDIAGKTRYMPEEFLHPEKSDVTEKFIMYLRPLLGRNMTEIFRLRHVKVPKILKK